MVTIFFLPQEKKNSSSMPSWNPAGFDTGKLRDEEYAKYNFMISKKVGFFQSHLDCGHHHISNKS